MSLKVFGRNLALVASLGVLKAPIADWTRELNQTLAHQADASTTPSVALDVRPLDLSDGPDEQHDTRGAVSARASTLTTVASPSTWVPEMPAQMRRVERQPWHDVAAWTPLGPLPSNGSDLPESEFPAESAQASGGVQGPQGAINARIASRSPAQGPQGPQGEQLPQRRLPMPVAAMEGPTPAKPDDTEREHSTDSAQDRAALRAVATGTQYIKPKGIPSAEAVATPAVRAYAPGDALSEALDFFASASPEMRAAFLERLRQDVGVQGAVGPTEPPALTPQHATGGAMQIHFPTVTPLGPFKKA